MVGFSPDSLWQQTQPLLPEKSRNDKALPSLCVAFSGGVDSTVLLHALSVLLTHAKTPFSLRAIHINHQLQAESDQWVTFCDGFCLARGIPFQSVVVDVIPSKKGIEAAARQARYSAFKKALNSEEILLTAHHLDDQVETVFLQLLRGTGVDGAGAMAPVSNANVYPLIRPMLSVERAQLEAYAKQEGLTWIDDPSNAEENFSRNFLRKKIFPVIEDRWPGYRKTIQRFSNNARSASTVLASYLEEDYVTCCVDNHDALGIALDIEPLKLLVIEKRLMIIRHWLKSCNAIMPGERVLMQIHSAIFSSEDANPLIEWGQYQVRRYQNMLYFLMRDEVSVMPETFHWDMKQPYKINDRSQLISQHIVGDGIHERYGDEQVTIAFRQGGEKCQPFGRLGTHSLKKLFQEYAIPPWMRDKVPLLMIDNQIAAIVGYCYCRPFAVQSHESGIIIRLNLDLV